MPAFAEAFGGGAEIERVEAEKLINPKRHDGGRFELNVVDGPILVGTIETLRAPVESASAVDRIHRDGPVGRHKSGGAISTHPLSDGDGPIDRGDG